MASGLITKEVFHVDSDFGTSKIELCVGDITKLRREEKVDVLLLSAYEGDYSPTPSSLIGQLEIQLGISVNNLSKAKEEDLRKQYYCWWSKPLPDHLSYGRILCFEGAYGANARSPPMVIGAIFRCLVPILKNKEGSVIMPLITTGDQQYPKDLVLNQILKASVNWIKAGLPLKNLKIVIFSRNLPKDLKSNVHLFNIFKQFTVDVNISTYMQQSRNVFISRSSEDFETVTKLKKLLEEKGCIVCSDMQEVNKDQSWQDGIYKTMLKCSCIIVLCTPYYIQSDVCLEQYNMALCISQRKKQNILVFSSIDNGSRVTLPTYIGQMQIFRMSDFQSLKDAADMVCQNLNLNHTTSLGENTILEQAVITEVSQRDDSAPNYSIEATDEKLPAQDNQIDHSSKFQSIVSLHDRGRNKSPTEQDEM